MSHRPKKIVLSSVYSGTVQVSSTMHAESVANHSRRKVRRQQNYVVHTWTFLPKAPSDRRVTQNGENDDQCWQRQECTFLPDKMELFRVHTCRWWYVLWPMSIQHHFHGCQKRRWYVLRLLSGAISSTWLYFFTFTQLVHCSLPDRQPV